jgi:hypothetical protein
MAQLSSLAIRVVASVITEAGNEPKVAGLVYVTAFAPDQGESVPRIIESVIPS